MNNRPLFNMAVAIFGRAAVDKTGECWIWNGCLDKNGYGRVSPRDRKLGLSCTFFAHRLSYEINVGPTEGLFVCHKCDNPRCVKPEHLFLGTNEDNVSDRVRKGRNGRTGNRYRPEIVAAVKAGVPVPQIARKFDVDNRGVQRLKNRLKGKSA